MRGTRTHLVTTRHHTSFRGKRGNRRLLSVFFVSFLLVGGHASAARAQSHATVALTWRAPAGCPTAAELRASISHALDWNAFAPDLTPELLLAGEAHAVGERWSISLSLTSPTGDGLGRRELASETAVCADVLDSVALVAAMMIESPRPEARLTLPRPARGDGWRIAGAAAPTVDFFTGPSPAFGVRAEIEVTAPHAWPIRLAAAFFPESVATRGSVVASFRLLTLGLGTCPALYVTTDATVDVCVGMDVVLIQETGAGLSPAHPYLDALPRPFAGMRGDLRLVGPLHLGAGAELGVPIVRYRYEFELGTETVLLHEIPAATVTAWVSLSLALP